MSDENTSHNNFPDFQDATRVHQEQKIRRALEAYRFFFPTVSVEAVFRGFRSVGAVDNRSAVILVTAPRHLNFTANSDTSYAGCVLDLRAAGPMLIELPAGPLVGMIDDHHQRWVADLGLPGPFGARGGRHLILPPDWTGPEPQGDWHVSRCTTYQALVLLRAVPVDGDTIRARALLETVVIRPEEESDARAEFLPCDDRDMDTTPLAWEDNLEYWRVLHEVLDDEPPLREFRPMLGALAELGIEAGKPFAPDSATERLLTEVARRGHDEMLVSAFASYRPDCVAWPDRVWEWVNLRPENGDFEREGSLDVEARDRWFAQTVASSPAVARRAPGQGSVYWLANRDADGTYLKGGSTYRLTVPLPVPASLFWSVTCYDARTRSEVRAPQQQAALRSLTEDLTGDGETVDLYFGPEKPQGADGRWIQTEPGHEWFAYFRVYGPGEATFDGSWRPGDFVPVVLSGAVAGPSSR